MHVEGAALVPQPHDLGKDQGHCIANSSHAWHRHHVGLASLYELSQPLPLVRCTGPRLFLARGKLSGDGPAFLFRCSTQCLGCGALLTLRCLSAIDGHSPGHFALALKPSLLDQVVWSGLRTFQLLNCLQYPFPHRIAVHVAGV